MHGVVQNLVDVPIIHILLLRGSEHSCFHRRIEVEVQLLT